MVSRLRPFVRARVRDLSEIVRAVLLCLVAMGAVGAVVGMVW